MFTPIIALGSEIVTLLFLIFAFLSWLASLGKDAAGKQQGPRPARPPQARDERLKNEIELFLEEVGKGTAPRTQPKPRQRSRPPKPRTPPTLREQRKGSESKKQTGTRQKPETTVAAGMELHDRRLSSDLQRHVSEYMDDDRIEQHVDDHIGNEITESVNEHIAQSVSQHLGPAETTRQETRTETLSRPAQIATLLRSPSGMRQAILLSELLSPPRALRK